MSVSLSFPSLEIAGVRTLSELPQWVLWRAVERAGKLTKVPRDPKQARNASVTDPKTWGTFEQAYDGSARYECDGIGFVFTANDSYIGVDLDKCVDADGRVDTWAREIVEQIDSYTELSPSGRGLHVICTGDLTGKRRRRGSVECYDDRRFFTVTGNVLDEREAISMVGDLSWVFDQGPSPRHTETPEPIGGNSHDQLAALERSLAPHATADADIQQERLSLLKEAAGVVGEIWERTAAVGKDWSPSEWDLSLANYFVGAGWDDVGIMHGLIAFRRKHGDNLKLDREPPSYYYARTITTARLGHERDEAQEMISAAAIATVPDEDRRTHILRALSAIYGVTISAIMKLPGDPNRYEIVTSKGTVRGEVDMLINQISLRRSMADVVGLIIAKARPARHDERCQAMLNIAEVGSIGEEATDAGQIREWVRQYIINRNAVPPEFCPEALIEGEPFYRDRHLWIPGLKFRRWLALNQMARVEARRFGVMMRAAGCSQTAMHTSVKGKKTSFSAWKIPHEVME